jgi:phosphoribosyl 1,2-cyclic phosphodiesterase
VRVHFLGVRGSSSAPGANFVRYGGSTSCLALAHDEDLAPSLLLDAGTGIRRVGALWGGEAFAGTILLTHLHWDHVQGLPFFSGADRDDSRAELFVPEQPDGTGAVEVLRRSMSPPNFPIGPEDLRGKWTFSSLPPGTLEVEGFTVEAREIPHKGGRTFGYRVSDGSSVLAYMPDHCPSALGPGPDGWGEYHSEALSLAAGADALVHDAQMSLEEMAAAVFLGHSSAEYAVELGRRARARLVVLFHHQPDRTDDTLDEMAKRFATGPPVIVAAESVVLEL